ncbi:MAG TPA: VOC family protein [Anaerolineales bacterium]|nr:VOC family protein [Anaerolineales bacterium]
MMVDHLVFAAPNLEAGVAEIEDRLGVRASFGGRHPGRGTQNAILALGPASYLEILAPDPAQTDVRRPLWFGLDRLETPRLVAWAAKSSDLDKLATEASRNGIRLGDIGHGSRQGPRGERLRWRFTDPATVVAGGLVPFFIDWGTGPHPAATAPRGAELVSLRGEHPDAQGVRRALDVLGIDLSVQPGGQPRLIAVLATRSGEVTLE